MAKIFFTKYVAATGYELWVSDGTAGGTHAVKDIDPGAGNSEAGFFFSFQNNIYFRADDGTHGFELWKSDGTLGGTSLVKDITSGAVGGFAAASNSTISNNTLYLTASDSTHGLELWKTNGTAAGTVLVKDINAGANSSSPHDLTDLNGTLFFAASDGVTGPSDAGPQNYDLWKSNGTAAGTVKVQDFQNVGALVALNGFVYFNASSPGGSDAELWRSNGTTTTVVKDINPGMDGSLPGQLFAFNNAIYFSADDGTSGRQLWTSDGTEAGTVKVDTSNVFKPDSFFGPEGFTVAGGKLFFFAEDLTHGFELWTTDGTDGGTTMLTDPNAGVSIPFLLQDSIAFNGALYFVATNSTNGMELWKSDGTVGGTAIFKDIAADAYSSVPSQLTVADGKLYFEADDLTGTYLWVSDGTAGGTTKVQDISNPSFAYNYQMLVASGGHLFFNAGDRAHAFDLFDIQNGELWTTDGTAAGTKLLKDIRPGEAPSNPGYDGVTDISGMTAVGGTVYFTANDGVNNQALWKSDGTSAGTVLVSDNVPQFQQSGEGHIQQLTAAGSLLFFTAGDVTHGRELWVSDGTDGGTHIVKDVNGSAADSIASALNGSDDGAILGAIGSEIYFAADDGNGTELWKSDGTSGNTQLVKDINGAAFGSNPHDFVTIGSELYFIAEGDSDHTFEEQLWKSDGTTGGTVQVSGISPDGNDGVQHLVSFGGALYFQANDGNGAKLWKYDGTTASSITTATSSDSSHPDVIVDDFTVASGKLYFTARVVGPDNSIWVTDGTQGGSHQVYDAGGIAPDDLTAVGANLFFVVEGSGQNPDALWVSLAGAAAHKVRDLGPISTPELVSFNNSLYYIAPETTASGSPHVLWKADANGANAVIVGGALEDTEIAAVAAPPPKQVTGTANNDTLLATATNEHFDGLGGNDFVSYANSTAAGVTASLFDPSQNSGSFAAGDTYDSIEGLIGSKNGDALTGGTGDDTLIGGLGADQLDGAGGNDTVSYAASTLAVTINLSAQGTYNDIVDPASGHATTPAAQHGGDAEGDTFWSIEKIIGSSKDDTIGGGGTGVSIDGGAGNDTITHGAGGETLDGGIGIDTVSFEGSSDGVSLTLGAYNATTKADASSSAVVGSIGFGGTIDQVSNFENVTGTGQLDIITGNETANALKGLAGADTLSGGAGNDTLSGGADGDVLIGDFGADVLDGGDGFDTASYFSSTAGVTVTLGVGGALTKATGGDAAGDFLINIESLIGGQGNDVLTGNEQANALDGDNGNDALSGGAGNDNLTGDAGSDTLDGGAGNDTLFGGDGDDLLIGGAGNDLFLGGDLFTQDIGKDTASYAASTLGVTVSLASNGTIFFIIPGMGSLNNNAVAQHGGDAEGDLFYGIDNVIGSAKNDILTGNAGENTISGGDGDDTIDGGGGNDILDGGKGVNTLSFASLTAAVTVLLNGASPVSVESSSTLGFATNFQNVTGGSGDDQLVGDAGNNAIAGGAGNDLLAGGAGNDTLTGGAGNDTYFYDGQGKDTIVGFEGGAGTDAGHGDVIAIGSKFSDYGTLLASTADVGGNAVITFSATSTLTLQGVAKASLNIDDFEFALPPVGTPGPDNLVGTKYGEKIDGLAGDDIIEGREGGDTLIGGTGNDTLSYEHSATYVNAELVAGKAAETSQGDASGDVATGFENLRGSAFDDFLAGDTGNNTIEGGAGADSLEGGSGGFDTVSYAHSSVKVYVNLDIQDGNAQASTSDTVTPNGDAEGDVLFGFKGVIGSAFDDTVQGGGTFADTIFGMDGGDNLSGGEGNFADTLNGGNGNDFLYGGAGADILNGGDGEDALTYGGSGATVGITITLDANGNGTGTGGEAQGDKFTSIEDVYGSEFADKLTGNAGINFLSGQDGNDVIAGGGGDDTLEGNEDDDVLIGGAGSDNLDGGNGFDTVDYSASSASVSVDLLFQGDYATSGDPNSGRDFTGLATADGDHLWSIEKAIGTKFGDQFSISGNTVDAGAGDDSVSVYGAGNTIIGGLGQDIVIYMGSTGITVDLSRQWTVDAKGNLTGGAVAHGGTAEGDKLSGIENLDGGSGSDILIGDANANDLEGGAGDDRLAGGGGNDRLFGGANADTFVYDAQGKDVIGDFTQGQDHIEIAGGTYNDFTALLAHTSLVNSGQDTLIDFGGGKTLTLEGFTGTLGSGDFVFNMPIKGTAGNDTLSGNDKGFGALPNNIDGLAGDDTIEGLGGGDVMTGGVGNDTLSYEHSGSAVSVMLVAGQAAQTSGGDAAGDAATLFENIKGSDFGDMLAGDTGANAIDGGAGDDEIDGGAGNDTLVGGAGNDDINGGAGTGDTADYSYLSAGPQLTIMLDGTGGATTSGISGDVDTLSNIENLSGGAENDIFTGNNGVNVLKGGNGDDTLNGDGGKDILDGGAGNDTADFTGGSAGLTIALKDNGALTTVTGGGTSAGTQLIGIENLTGGDGDDKFTGNSGDNKILGGNGSDTITATLGNDNYDGGNDFDDLTFAAFKTGVTVNLADHSGSTTGATYSIDNFERILGGTGDDVFIAVEGGGASPDGDIHLGGGAGNDTIDFSREQTSALDIDLRKQFNVDSTGSFNAASGGSTPQDDYLLGGFENLVGGKLDDKLVGTAGNNIIEGGAGNDTLVGAGGIDTVSYGHATAGVTVDLSQQGAGDFSGHHFSISLPATAQTGGDAQGDKLYGFTNIIGGSGGDSLTGDGFNNVIDGGSGDGYDTLTGGAGDDTLLGGGGNDTFLAGGAGGAGADIMDGGTDDNDVVDYTGETVGFTVTLGLDGKAAKVTGGAGSNAKGDTLINIDHVIGGSGADVIVGGNVTHYVETLEGKGGNDVLKGGAGNSILDGGDNDDKIFAGAGAVEQYTGGNGNDTLTFETFASGVTVTLGENAAVGAAAGIGQLTVADDFEILIGGSGGDTLTGSLGHWTEVHGGLGNDTVAGGSQADKLDGGAGTSDTVSYANDAQDNTGVTIDLTHQYTVSAQNVFSAGTTGAVMTGGSAAGDILAGFENVIGGADNDIITGDKNNNIIDGGAGDDTLDGGAGNDTLTGGIGNDTLKGGVGADNLDGGADSDTADYSSSALGVTVNLSIAGAQAGGDAAGDKLTSIENLIGSAKGDVLTGNAVANVINGGAGDDVIQGGAGADTLIGGGGNDTVSYANDTHGVFIDLQFQNGVQTQASNVGLGNDAEGDILSGFVNAIGGGGDDQLVSAADTISLSGGLGDDSLLASAAATGAQVFDGGGNGTAGDTLTYLFADGVTIALGTNGAQTVAHGGIAEGDKISNIENLVFSGSAGGNVITGNNLANFISISGSNNTVEGGGGADRLQGSTSLSSNNTVSYAHSANGVTVDLSQEIQDTNQNSDAKGDDILFFHNLTGSAKNDILRGDAINQTTTFGTNYNNVIDGGAGDDTIEGRQGADTLNGGLGTGDWVSYESSAAGVFVSLVTQGTINSSGAIVGGAVAQSNGDAAGDLLYGFENIRGSENDDELTGDNGVNTIDGGGGNDRIFGGQGDDTLLGGAGDDSFLSSVALGIGKDKMDGGDGFDKVDYIGNTIGITVALGANGAAATVSGPSGSTGAGDILINIEEVDGSNAADKITGNNLDHVLHGNDGNDTLTGGTGSSDLNGGSGDDIIFASTGAVEKYDGGGEALTVDTLSFANITTGVSVDLSTGTGTVTGIGSLTVSNFEVLIGTGKDDILTGNATTGTNIQGGAGNDTITGGTAADTLSGGAGSDKFVIVDAAQGFDHIVDFAVGDKLQVSQSGFAHGLDGLAAGALTDATYFKSGAGVASDASGHGQFLYNTTSHDLSWDADGAGGNGATTIAHFDNNYVVKITDFLLS